MTNGEFREAVQWVYDQGLIWVTGNGVYAYGHELLDLDDNHCELTFDGNEFGLREAPNEHAANAYPEGYDPSDHPVKEVSWFGAACYCDWRSQMEGLVPYYNGVWSQDAGHDPYTAVGYRLPTEAEWEYAVRYDDGRIYPWGDDTPDCDYANCSDDGACVGWTTPVGSYPLGAGALGLLDPAGNIWELCGDWYGDYSGSSQSDPYGPASGFFRVLRGGGYFSGAMSLRSSARDYCSPGDTDGGIGFRVCRTAGP